MDAKKILIFIDWYKPGYKAGGPIRSISNMVDYLYDYADLYIVTRNTDYLDTKPYPSINPDKWNAVDNASVYYFSEANISYKNIKGLIKEIQPDSIYCNSLYSLYFTIIPLYISRKRVSHRVLATRGMLSPGALAVKSLKKKIFLFCSKFMGIFNNIVFHATSADEENDINQNFNFPPKVSILQNLPHKKMMPYEKKEKEIGHLNLVYVGRIAPEKNTLYALKTLVKSKEKIRFDIYGPIYNQSYWNECKIIISKLPNNVIAAYKGVLPHELLNTTLKKYHALLLPSTGENFGHIIIESMKNSCIPIISNKTPWKDLESKQVGFDINLNNLDEFTTKIDAIALMNQSEFNDINNKTYQYGQKLSDNKNLIEKYIRLFQL